MERNSGNRDDHIERNSGNRDDHIDRTPSDRRRGASAIFTEGHRPKNQADCTNWSMLAAG